MSHGAWFRKRSDLVEAIEAAMDEAMDQGASLALPTVREGNPVTLQQARLMTVAGRRSVASVPLLDRGLPAGVLTLERGIDDAEFDARALLIAAAIAALAAPTIADRQGGG